MGKKKKSGRRKKKEEEEGNEVQEEEEEYKMMRTESRLTDAIFLFTDKDRLVGLVVKVSASRAEGPGFESR